MIHVLLLFISSFFAQKNFSPAGLMPLVSRAGGEKWRTLALFARGFFSDLGRVSEGSDNPLGLARVSEKKPRNCKR